LNWIGFTKTADDYEPALLSRLPDQGEVPFVQRPHGRHEPDSVPCRLSLRDLLDDISDSCYGMHSGKKKALENEQNPPRRVDNARYNIGIQ
jgi:hypothetical protein